MDWDDYLRQQAVMYLQLAGKTGGAVNKQELLDLAAVCEEVANNIEDRQLLADFVVKVGDYLKLAPWEEQSDFA